MKMYNGYGKLSNTEELIMQCVYEADHDVSVPDLIDAMKYRSGKLHTKSAMNTFLNSIMEKGYLKRFWQGHGYRYVPAVSEREFKDIQLGLLRPFGFKGSAFELIASFVRENRLSEEEKKQLRDMLDH